MTTCGDLGIKSGLYITRIKGAFLDNYNLNYSTKGHNSCGLTLWCVWKSMQASIDRYKSWTCTRCIISWR
jgi:hypothetical protein